jgi:hypothetical protein
LEGFLNGSIDLFGNSRGIIPTHLAIEVGIGQLFVGFSSVLFLPPYDDSPTLVTWFYHYIPVGFEASDGKNIISRQVGAIASVSKGGGGMSDATDEAFQLWVLTWRWCPTFGLFKVGVNGINWGILLVPEKMFQPDFPQKLEDIAK